MNASQWMERDMGGRAKHGAANVATAIEPVAPMKRTRRSNLTKLVAGILGGTLLATALAAGAADSGSDDGWEVGVEAYLWAPWIDVTTETGGDVEITLKDILSDLDMLFMSALSVRHDKWKLLSDFIYFKIDQGDNSNVAPGITLSDVTLEAWIVTPQVRYAAYEADDLRVEVLGGARYLWLEAELDLTFQAPLPPDRRTASDGVGKWDGIVGVTGQWDFADKWYATGYFDVGTGQTDYTWQVLASVAYRFKRLDAVMGYRYLQYEFDKDDAIKDLDVRGPFFGAKFLF
jgi:hypothetical protein